VVYRGRLHRLESSGARAPFGQIEAFWAFLQRQLRSTGGIRRERLGLYLAAFAWRYNHRKLPRDQQVSALLAMLRALD
jgi:transposase-like protein